VGTPGQFCYLHVRVAADKEEQRMASIQRNATGQPCPERRRNKTRAAHAGYCQGAAIKFDEIGPAGELVVGEGVETCMAARQLGLRPTWALGSVGAISFLPLIDTVGQLIILGEAGEASARAIQFCTKRWRAAGRRVRVAMPDPGLSDFNEVLIALDERRGAS
jgi:hypothetical protein